MTEQETKKLFHFKMKKWLKNKTLPGKVQQFIDDWDTAANDLLAVESQALLSRQVWDRLENALRFFCDDVFKIKESIEEERVSLSELEMPETPLQNVFLDEHGRISIEKVNYIQKAIAELEKKDLFVIDIVENDKPVEFSEEDKNFWKMTGLSNWYTLKEIANGGFEPVKEEEL
jgi:hypothetical protein